MPRGEHTKQRKTARLFDGVQESVWDFWKRVRNKLRHRARRGAALQPRVDDKKMTKSLDVAETVEFAPKKRRFEKNVTSTPGRKWVTDGSISFFVKKGIGVGSVGGI